MTEKIIIDYPGGSHGNYLNLILDDIVVCGIYQYSINDSGATHARMVHDTDLFWKRHEFELDNHSANKICIVTTRVESLLVMNALWLTRRGTSTKNHEHFDLNQLSYADTEVLSNLKAADGWSTHWRKELFRFSRHNPSRNALSLILPVMQISYKNIMPVLKGQSLIQVPFESFYDFDWLVRQVRDIISVYKLPELTEKKFELLKNSYDDFSKSNQYINIFRDIDTVLNAVNDRVSIPIPEMFLVAEALVDYRLKKDHRIAFNPNESYYTNTSEIIAKL